MSEIVEPVEMAALDSSVCAGDMNANGTTLAPSAMASTDSTIAADGGDEADANDGKQADAIKAIDAAAAARKDAQDDLAKAIMRNTEAQTKLDGATIPAAERVKAQALIDQGFQELVTGNMYRTLGNAQHSFAVSLITMKKWDQIVENANKAKKNFEATQNKAQIANMKVDMVLKILKANEDNEDAEGPTEGMPIQEGTPT